MTSVHRWLAGAWGGLLLAVMVAALLRYPALDSIPPGLSFDEAGNGVAALDVARGEYRLWWPIGGGKEPLIAYLVQPLFWLLDKIHGMVQNWGWSIIILTIIIKLAFYKLSETSYRSMAKMRKIQPRLVAIKERHEGDREALNRAMMTMYKEEKINPLGGCLPILAQIPVFIALYWVLLESVELRQADFIFWLNDLSSADPFFVLPLLMGATMLIQFKLNPAPMDPIQAKVMMMLPLIFTVFFAFFPAGLVLYWVVNNTLSISQQWYITRNIERGEK